jgi:hypothetical protein
MPRGYRVRRRNLKPLGSLVPKPLEFKMHVLNRWELLRPVEENVFANICCVLSPGVLTGLLANLSDSGTGDSDTELRTRHA